MQSDAAAALPTLLGFVAPSMRRLVESRLRTTRVARGRTIVSAGSHNSDVYFIVEGEVQVLLHATSGREVSVRRLKPGEMFGELAAIDGGSRSANVTAVSDVRLLAMSQNDFTACLESSPGAALWCARRLSAEVRRLTERVFELSALNVQARLHCELLRLARTTGSSRAPLEITPAPTHAELANRIGSHREAVTREMRALAGLNIIRQTRRTLQFVDLSQLELAVGRVTTNA